MPRLAAVLIALALAACGGGRQSAAPTTPAPPVSGTPDSPPAEAPEAAAGEMMAPPFTADQLRAGMPVGTVMRYRFTEGSAIRVEEWAVTAADDETVTMTSKVFAADGATLVEDQGPSISRWTELESHGRFPVDSTEASLQEIDVPAGHFTTRYYEVRRDGLVQRYHFTASMPGPPIWLEISKDGQPIMTMELLARTGPR